MTSKIPQLTELNEIRSINTGYGTASGGSESKNEDSGNKSYSLRKPGKESKNGIEQEVKVDPKEAEEQKNHGTDRMQSIDQVDKTNDKKEKTEFRKSNIESKQNTQTNNDAKNSNQTNTIKNDEVKLRVIKDDKTIEDEKPGTDLSNNVDGSRPKKYTADGAVRVSKEISDERGSGKGDYLKESRVNVASRGKTVEWENTKSPARKKLTSESEEQNLADSENSTEETDLLWENDRHLPGKDTPVRHVAGGSTLEPNVSSRVKHKEENSDAISKNITVTRNSRNVRKAPQNKKTTSYTCNLTTDISSDSDSTTMIPPIKSTRSVTYKNGSMETPVKLTQTVNIGYEDDSLGRELYQLVAEAAKITNNTLEQVRHFVNTAKYLFDLQVRNKQCDIVLDVAGTVYSAHAILLVCYSQFFEKMLSTREKNKKSVFIVKLENVSPEAVRVFICFAYSGNADINPGNIGEVFFAAILLESALLMRVCCGYKGGIKVDQALLLLNYPQIVEYDDLFTAVIRTMLKNFVEAVQIPIFQHLSPDILMGIISDNRLQVPTELVVFNAAINWLTFKEERSKYMRQVMECVRFPRMSIEELAKVIGIVGQTLGKSNESLFREKVLNACWSITVDNLQCKDPLELPVPPPRKKSEET